MSSVQCVLVYRTASRCSFFFFNDTATTEIYTLSLHDALPIWHRPTCAFMFAPSMYTWPPCSCTMRQMSRIRSEEHTSELQSPCNLVCRLLLEKKKNQGTYIHLATCLASWSVATRSSPSYTARC